MLPKFSPYEPTPLSCGTDDAPLFFQQRVLLPQRWRMTQYTAMDAQIIDIVNNTRACDLDEITSQCTNLTWNQVFLAVDRLSRSGEIVLIPSGRGMYTLIIPHRQGGRPARRSLPS